MRQSTSEIFNSYAQIALDTGLIAEAEEQTNPRYDSRTLSDIEILYGIQPNGKDDDILDQAHPKSIIIAPAYDRVNGLVENLKEQHNIMCDIALKPNNGLLTQHRYVEANQALLDEVIKVSFLLDKNDETELMKLADSCSERIVKTAFWPLLIGAGVVIGVSALVHAIYSSNNPNTQGLTQDAKRTEVEINEAIEQYPQLAPVLSPILTNIRKLISLSGTFVKYNDQVVASLLTISGALTPEEKRQAITKNTAEIFSSGKATEIVKVSETYKNICDAITTSIPTAISYLTKAKTEIEEPDSQWFHDVKKVFRLGLNNDIDDSIEMLKVLYKSVSTASVSISETLSNLAKLKEVTNGNLGKVNQLESSDEVKPTESKTEPKKQEYALPSWG